MVKQAEWVTLTFDFTSPVGKFPAILERLSGTPARLEEKLGGLPEEKLTRSHVGKWSAQEHAGHLLDLEDLIDKRLEEYESDQSILSAADMKNRKTREARYNDRDIADILASFRRRRMELVRRMAAYDEAMVLRSALHPRLKTPMRVIDLALFSAEHDDHHLAAIQGILAK